MNMIRFRPTRDMMTLQQEMNRLFNETLQREEAQEQQVQWAPRVDVAESQNEIVVQVEVPGMRREEIVLTIEDNVLTLSGEKKQEALEGYRYHRAERTQGRFRRTFSLPASIDTAKVKAAYKDGLLTITLPKVEAHRPKEITVSVG